AKALRRRYGPTAAPIPSAAPCFKKFLRVILLSFMAITSSLLQSFHVQGSTFNVSEPNVSDCDFRSDETRVVSGFALTWNSEPETRNSAGALERRPSRVTIRCALIR